MNFGFRLPGPFRVSVSDKGRVYGGVTMGPFSVSGQLGGGRSAPQGPTVFPVSLGQAQQELAAAGWVVVGREPGGFTVRRRWRLKMGHVRQVPGGVVAEPRTNSWVLAVTIVAVVAGLWIWLG